MHVIVEYAGALWVAVLADGRRIAGDDLKEVTRRVYDSGGIPFVSRYYPVISQPRRCDHQDGTPPRVIRPAGHRRETQQQRRQLCRLCSFIYSSRREPVPPRVGLLWSLRRTAPGLPVVRCAVDLLPGR